jgi:c-di-GMP-binding flagellar brake protein YcgR
VQDSALWFLDGETGEASAQRRWERIVSRITEARLEGGGQALFVWDGRRAHRLSGADLGALHEGLEQTVQRDMRSGGTTPFLLQPGERVLDAGRVRLGIDPTSSADGTLFVTSLRVHFEPKRHGGAPYGAEAAWFAWLSELTAASLCVQRSLLRVHASHGRRAVFLGGNVAHAAELLLGLVPRLDVEEAPPWYLGPAIVGESPGQPVLWSASAQEIVLRTEDGAQLLAWAETATLALVQAVPEGCLWRLSLFFEGGEWALTVSDGITAVQDLVWAWLEAAPRRAEGAPEDKQALVATQAACWLSPTSARFGRVELDTEHALFSGAAGVSLDPLTNTVPLQTLQRGNSDHAESDVLHLLGESSQMVLSPAGGSLFVERFWDAFENRQAQGSSQPARAPVSRLLGEASLVRFSRNGVTVLEFADSEVSMVDSVPACLSLSFPGVPDSSFDIGAEVRIEVAKAEAVYAFDSRIWWIDRSPQLQDRARPSHLFQIHVLAPNSASRFNRRESFRVPIEPPRPVRLRCVSPPRAAPLCGHLLDLSSTGCRVHSYSLPPAEAILRLEIPGHVGDFEILANVVHVRAVGPGDGTWELGMRFRALEPRAQAKIAQEMMAQQRALLRDRVFLRGEQ